MLGASRSYSFFSRLALNSAFCTQGIDAVKMGMMGKAGQTGTLCCKPNHFIFRCMEPSIALRIFVVLVIFVYASHFEHAMDKAETWNRLHPLLQILSCHRPVCFLEQLP